MTVLLPHHRSTLEDDSSISPGAIQQRGYFSAQTIDELKALGFHSADKSQVPSLVIPIHGVDGDVVYYQHRPDSPRIRDGKPVKYESLPGQPPRIDIPPPVAFMLDDPSVPLWITEGSKKADSAAVRGLCCIALIGVWNWRGTNAKGGSLELADWDRIAIKGRVIYIAFDSDVMVKPEVKKALQRLARFLKRRGAKEIRPVVIPKLSGGKTGLDDWFAAGHGYTELMQSVDTDLLRHDGIIVNNRGLADITADALTVLAEANFPPFVFQHDGALCRIRESDDGLAKIEDLTTIPMRGILSRITPWVVAKKEGTVETSPPKEVADDLLSSGDWPDIPVIVGVSESPTLNPDYTLNEARGYSEKSRTFLASREQWKPWSGTSKEALGLILNEMLGDFPFVGDASRAHALGLMLLPIVRPIISGPTPFHLIGAPQAGMGKSLLSRICLIPTCGKYIYPTGVTSDEEEWRKIVTTALAEGPSYVFFDNLTHKVRSAALDAAFTATHWKGRLLSVSRNITVPVRCVWLGSSNNAELSPDLTRRTVHIQIDAEIERPEDRQKWHHADIETWTRENRVAIVSALCHLVNDWVNDGAVAFDGRLIGSYEEWTRVIGGILKRADVKGFLDNIDKMRATVNPEDASWADFYHRWYALKGTDRTRAGELLEEFEADEALVRLIGDKNELSRKNRLGFLLQRRVGAVAGGFKIEDVGIYQKSRHYRIVPVGGVEPPVRNSPTTPLFADEDDSGSNEGLFGGVGGVGGVNNTLTHTHAHDARDEHFQQHPQTPPVNLNAFATPLANSPDWASDDEDEVIDEVII